MAEDNNKELVKRNRAVFRLLLIKVSLIFFFGLQEKFSKELKKIAFCYMCGKQENTPKKSSQNGEQIAMVTINASPRHLIEDVYHC